MERTHEGNVLRTNGVVKYVAAVSTVIIQTLIDDIPGVVVGAIILHSFGDMVLHGSLESSVGPRSRGRGHPVGQLRIPDKIVAANLLASSHGKVDDLLTLREGEGVLLWLGVCPLALCQSCVDEEERSQIYLHGIARSQLTEDCLWSVELQVIPRCRLTASVIEYGHILLVRGFSARN